MFKLETLYYGCLVLAGVTVAPVVPVEAQVAGGPLQLEIYLDKDTFYQDEPIYSLLRLTNMSDRTVYVSPFELWSNQLDFRFYREPSGEMVPHGGLELLEAYGDGLGDPIGPGESFYHLSSLAHHGVRGDHNPWTNYRTLLPGEYRLEVRYVSNLRGAVFDEGDPGVITAEARVTVIPRGPEQESEFQRVLELFQRLGRFDERYSYKMSASGVRATLRDAEAFVRTNPQSPFVPLVTASLLDQLKVRAVYARGPAVPGSEIRSSIDRIKARAAEGSPYSLSRLSLVLCRAAGPRETLLDEVGRAAADSSRPHRADVAQAVLEFVRWVDSDDPRGSVGTWQLLCK